MRVVHFKAKDGKHFPIEGDLFDGDNIADLKKYAKPEGKIKRSGGRFKKIGKRLILQDDGYSTIHPGQWLLRDGLGFLRVGDQGDLDRFYDVVTP